MVSCKLIQCNNTLYLSSLVYMVNRTITYDVTIYNIQIHVYSCGYLYRSCFYFIYISVIFSNFKDQSNRYVPRRKDKRRHLLISVKFLYLHGPILTQCLDSIDLWTLSVLVSFLALTTRFPMPPNKAT